MVLKFIGIMLNQTLMLIKICVYTDRFRYNWRNLFGINV